MTTMSEYEMGGPPENTIDTAQSTFIGCLLAIAGNLLISFSLNLQKYTHLQNAKLDNPVHYTRIPMWWAGLLLMALGEIGNFSAYGFAPASLVAPLGTTTVIANMFIAVIFLKEQLRPEDLFGCVLAVIGAFLLVAFSTKTETLLTAENVIYLLKETAFIIYAVLLGVTIALLLFLKFYVQVQSVVITLLIASLIVIGTKVVSGMLQLTISGNMQVDTYIFWFMLFVVLSTCVITVNFLNQAMAIYDSTVVVPTNFVLFTTCTIVAGIVYFKEFYGLAPVDIFMFLFGCLLCFIGVYFITSGRSSKRRKEIQENEYERYRLHLELFPTWLFEGSFSKEADMLLRSLTIQISGDEKGCDTQDATLDGTEVEVHNDHMHSPFTRSLDELPTNRQENTTRSMSSLTLWRTYGSLSCDRRNKTTK